MFLSQLVVTKLTLRALNGHHLKKHNAVSSGNVMMNYLEDQPTNRQSPNLEALE